MVRRQTLATDISLSGVGLHSGRPVRMRLVPAEAETGIVFVRTDADGARLPATIEHVGPSFYATVLRRDELRISTVEHLMAALYALQVDDLMVELDGAGLPILDGSSRPFVEAILEAGRTELPVERQYMTLVRPVIVSDQEKRIAAYPSPEFRITYAIDFDHPCIGRQSLEISSLDEDVFERELAAARTFGFANEVEALRKAGLARGGQLENTVVLDKTSVLNPGGLRWPDEFVRHKIVDLIGDLALLGARPNAHIRVEKGGHRLHHRLVQEIQGRYALEPIPTPLRS